MTEAQLTAMQIAAQAAAQAGVVALLGLSWALAALGPRLAAEPRWRRRLSLVTVGAWALLVSGSLGSIPLTLWSVLGRWNLDLASSFLTSTAQGDAVVQRCLIATLLAALVMTGLRLGGRQRVDSGTWTGARLAATFGLILGAPLADTLSRLAHAALMSGTAYRALDAVHLYVAGVWGGGLVALALWPWSAPSGTASVATALARHSVTGLTAVTVLAASGILAAATQLPQPAALVRTEYGLALSAKLALVGATLLAAAYNRWRLLPRVRAVDASATVGRADSAGVRVGAGLRLEAALLLLVLLATAVLTTRPLPHQM